MNKTDIRLLVLDVDGVLTDGTILIDDEGRHYRRFHLRDGMGVVLWKAAGRQVALLTAKRSKSTQARAAMLGIELLEEGSRDKLPGLERILAATGIPAEQTAFMGDDLLDLAVMRRVGYPMTVADGADEAREIARYVTHQSGGQAAVREAIEHLLKREGAWEEALRSIGADRQAP